MAGRRALPAGGSRGAACVPETKGHEFLTRVILLTEGQASQRVTDPALLVKHGAELRD